MGQSRPLPYPIVDILLQNVKPFRSARPKKPPFFPALSGGRGEGAAYALTLALRIASPSLNSVTATLLMGSPLSSKVT